MNERAEEVRKTLKALSHSASASTLDCAELLYEAQTNNYPSLWGYRNLADYSAQELGLKPRKSQYLSRIVRVYKAVGLVRDNIETVAVSKLREIATLDPEASWFNPETKLNESLADCILDLFLQANDLTLDQIRKLVALYKGWTGRNQRITRSYSTDLSSYENVIKKAFELARKKLGSNGRDDAGNAKEYSDGACLEVICADWLSDPNNQENEPVPEEHIEDHYTPLPEEI